MLHLYRKLQEKISVNTDYTIEKSTNSGRTLFVEAYSKVNSKNGELSEWRLFSTHKYELIDDDTLKSTAKYTQVNLIDGEYVNKTKTYEKIRKLFQGKRIVVSYKVNGEDKEYYWKHISTSFDPFDTKHVSVRIHKRPEIKNNKYSEKISITMICISEQVGIKNFKDMYKDVIIGKWVDKNQLPEYRSLEFFKNGTYKFTTGENKEETGEFKIKKGIVKIKPHSSNYFTKNFEVKFNGFNSFQISEREEDNTSYIGSYSREKK